MEAEKPVQDDTIEEAAEVDETEDVLDDEDECEHDCDEEE